MTVYLVRASSEQIKYMYLKKFQPLKVDCNRFKRLGVKFVTNAEEFIYVYSCIYVYSLLM